MQTCLEFRIVQRMFKYIFLKTKKFPHYDVNRGVFRMGDYFSYQWTIKIVRIIENAFYLE